MKVLVTGGLGYIGSHTAVELLRQGNEVVIVDNLVNSSIDVLDKIETITNKKVKCYIDDVCDSKALDRIFKENKDISDVIHFAGLKAVGESCKVPLKYYENNIMSTISLVNAMLKYNVNNLIFSSSATVYGIPESVPLYETSKVGNTTNPYGTTKLVIEGMLQDVCKVNPSFNVALLRYFNPIGADASGLIGEKPNGIPNNLMPYISQVAAGKLAKLSVFGNDYNTIDGTGVRDYIHVTDLALGHIAAISKLHSNPGLVIYNLGTGKGTSVLELVNAFIEATGIEIPYEIVSRRDGDIDTSYANCDKAKKELNWVATRSIKQACLDTWNFQKNIK